MKNTQALRFGLTALLLIQVCYSAGTKETTKEFSKTFNFEFQPDLKNGENKMTQRVYYSNDGKSEKEISLLTVNTKQKKLVSGKLRTKDGEVDAEILDKAPVVAYLFAASWCPNCRKFTPYLAQLYKRWNKKEKQIEIVWIPDAIDEKSYNEYLQEMPWLALPYKDKRIPDIQKKYKLFAVPYLVIVSKEDEKSLNNQAVFDILNHGLDAIGKWVEVSDKSSKKEIAK
jgi:Thiol-disulfide isomerase and thioredoxins